MRPVCPICRALYQTKKTIDDPFVGRVVVYVCATRKPYCSILQMPGQYAVIEPSNRDQGEVSSAQERKAADE